MYLYDLPSATTMGSTEYQENIPVGYMLKNSEPTYDGVLREAAIFNHLDIKVIVQKKWTSTNIEAKDQSKENKFNGFNVLPQSTKLNYQIVGFEVSPRSVPYSKACTPSMYNRGLHIVWPDEPFQFSYSIKFEVASPMSSGVVWSNRFDHYLKLKKN